MIGQEILHYQIKQKLGEGGMGVVYLAHDTKLDRDVAIKFLPRDIADDSEQRQRFQTEAKAAAALNHPNIGTVYAIEESDSNLFIAMEYIDGQELKQIIAAHRENPLTLQDIIRYTTQISAGLQAAHNKGIVHRDIKPSNIMITEDGTVKIMDFGLAKFRGAAQLTKTGTTLGTVAYMSPEQTLGEKVDQRSDIWSFAVMLYEMISGHLPFQGDYDPAIQYAIVNSDPEDITQYVKDIPPELQQILNKALDKDAEQRYQTAAELINDLRALGGEQPLEINTVQKKSKVIWPATAVLALLLVLVMYFLDPFSLFKKQAVRTIAVLPFLDLSVGADQEYFADGLAEELLNILAKNPQLRVTSRTSAFAFKGTNTDIKTIAEKLGVDHILEGSVRKAGNQLRITTQLIDVDTDAHMWSETYDQELENIFDVQENISRSVAEALEVTLLGKNQQIGQIKTNVEAYNSFLKGEFFLRQFHDEQSTQKAAEYFHQALDIDPAYARAWVSLGGTYLNLYLSGYCANDCLEKAIAAADKALELDPNSALALGLKGYMAMIFDWDLKTADEFMQEALKLEPENPIVIDASASVAGYLGRFDEAIALKKSALQKDPLNHITRNNLGIEYYYAGQLDMAKRTFRELLELNPKFRGIHTMISGIYLREGKVDSALLEIINETETGFQLYGSARAYFASGQLARADSFLHAFINEFSPVWDFQIAEVYAFRNEPDKAFEFLESAFMQKDPGFLLIRVSPFLDNIRQDPRYRELLKRVNLDVEKG